MQDKKAKFFKIYANLPAGTREEIVAVIDNDPYSWKAAKLEIEKDTPIGNKILDVLVNLGILI